MIIGRNLFFKCPKCERLTTRWSLISGNTAGAELYSDLKQIAPMLPEFPAIVKCKKCNTFFWLNEDNEVNYDFNDSDKAEFLSAYEYYEANNSNVHNNKDELQFLKIELWHKYNDRIRENKDLFLEKNDKEIYENNCLDLIELLDKGNINNKFIVAELYRNMRNFNECKNMLESIKNEEYNWIKELLETECNKNNKNVIRLRQ